MRGVKEPLWHSKSHLVYAFCKMMMVCSKCASSKQKKKGKESEREQNLFGWLAYDFIYRARIIWQCQMMEIR